jgi:Cft2 family RNA processing exonuclease
LLLFLRAYNAGHVLGAAMFMIEIAGVRVLYTGDFSREEDRHLMAAELPSASVRPGTTLRKFVSNIALQPTRDNFIADKSVYSFLELVVVFVVIWH